MASLTDSVIADALAPARDAITGRLGFAFAPGGRHAVCRIRRAASNECCGCPVCSPGECGWTRTPGCQCPAPEIMAVNPPNFGRRTLSLNRSEPGGPASGVAVDLVRRKWRRVWSVTAASDDRILLYSPISRRLVIRSNATGASRLGWAPLGDPGAHFPDTLCRPGYPRHALTWDESGERLLVHEADGARSRLFRYTPADDELAAVHTLPGAVSTPALWIGNRVHVPFSNPAHPRTLATIHGGTSGKPVGHTVRQRARWSEPAVSTVSTAPAASPVPTAPTMRSANRPGARLVRLAGADGPIEAIVYGGRDWLRRDQLVVALHGGPLSAWRCEFDPLLSSLAAAGMAVLAPNYRGSTGYGEQHLRAPIGCWGGPDLDDVSALGGRLHRDRADAGLPGPLVLGVSYGAYLALLAACAEATTWSGCVALAPFLSGPSLHASAGEAVRDRVAALGGLGRAEDPSTAPDVLRQCASLTAPLLLVHGSRDERVPVVQSRVLRRRLLELGRVEGVDFGYLEPDADHAGVIAEWPAPLLRRIVRFCRTRRVAPPAAGGSAEAPDGERR